MSIAGPASKNMPTNRKKIFNNRRIAYLLSLREKMKSANLLGIPDNVDIHPNTTAAPTARRIDEAAIPVFSNIGLKSFNFISLITKTLIKKA